MEHVWLKSNTLIKINMWRSVMQAWKPVYNGYYRGFQSIFYGRILGVICVLQGARLYAGAPSHTVPSPLRGSGYAPAWALFTGQQESSRGQATQSGEEVGERSSATGVIWQCTGVGVWEYYCWSMWYWWAQYTRFLLASPTCGAYFEHHNKSASCVRRQC